MLRKLLNAQFAEQKLTDDVTAHEYAYCNLCHRTSEVDHWTMERLFNNGGFSGLNLLHFFRIVFKFKYVRSIMDSCCQLNEPVDGINVYFKGASFIYNLKKKALIRIPKNFISHYKKSSKLLRIANAR